MEDFRLQQILLNEWYGVLQFHETAKHHTIHLKEFAAIENLPFYEIDIKEQNPMLCAAYIVVSESDMKVYRDALKPQRGELA